MIHSPGKALHFTGLVTRGGTCVTSCHDVTSGSIPEILFVILGPERIDVTVSSFCHSFYSSYAPLPKLLFLGFLGFPPQDRVSLPALTLSWMEV